MKDETLTVTGWPAVPLFLTVALTQVLTALVMALPITWLVNHVFAANAIHAVFASDRLGYGILSFRDKDFQINQQRSRASAQNAD